MISRKVYLLIKKHNALCLMLERFNDFWKFLLISVLSFYIIFIWFIVYVPIVYSKLEFITDLFMHLLLFEVIGMFACIVIIIFNVSKEVINQNFIIDLIDLFFRQNHFILFSTVFMSNTNSH